MSERRWKVVAVGVILGALLVIACVGCVTHRDVRPAVLPPRTLTQRATLAWPDGRPLLTEVAAIRSAIDATEAVYLRDVGPLRGRVARIELYRRKWLPGSRPEWTVWAQTTIGPAGATIRLAIYADRPRLTRHLLHELHHVGLMGDAGHEHPTWGWVDQLDADAARAFWGSD